MPPSPQPGAPQSGGAAAGARPAVAIVPARLGSTRLARKMLLRETGQYLFEHTVRRVESCGQFERVVLATDSDEIARAAGEVGIEALMTSDAHRSGTDRVNEALAILEGRGEGPFDVVVNVQGDEADLPADDLGTLLAAFDDPEVELATLAADVDDPAELADPHVVKVVCDRRGFALTFSRAPLAGGRHHVGVYGFRPAALARFCALEPGRLEQAERLEQLRWLEAGEEIRVVPASRVSGGIDTEQDYRAFVERVRSRGNLEGTPVR